jgi:separase
LGQQKDTTSSLDGLLQSLRLWNRAVDSLSRLRPQPQQSKPADVDPFEMSDLKDALPSEKQESSLPEKSFLRQTFLPCYSSDGLELRISQGLLDILFALCEAYFSRGSAREAEYFAQQAEDFAKSINAPAMVGRALARKGEVQLHQRRFHDGHQNLLQAMSVLTDTLSTTDRADIQRLHGDYNQRCAQLKDAQQLYAEAASMLEELDSRFAVFDNSYPRYVVSGSPIVTPLLDHAFRRSMSSSPKGGTVNEILVPTLLATVLHQHSRSLRPRSHP